MRGFLRAVSNESRLLAPGWPARPAGTRNRFRVAHLVSRSYDARTTLGVINNMAPKIRFSALAAFVLLLFGCGGSGGGGSGQLVAPGLTVTCTPDFIQKLGTSQCVAIREGSPADNDSIEWSASAGSIDEDGQFIAPTSAGNVTISAVYSPDLGTGELTVVISSARSLEDQPDTTISGQVHVLYVVASDGEDRTLDTDGTLALSVEAWNEWLAGQIAGARLRLDRDDGAVDISFVRLSRSNADMNAFGADLREQIEGEITARGFDDPEKVYLVYYDGGDVTTATCGAAAYPPDSPGTLAVLFLQAIPATGNPCNENAFADSVDAPGYIEFAALQEVLHVIGIVPACAPRQVLDGHVSDSPTDIMYAGNQAWDPSAIDVGRDDYYQAGIADCVDLVNSRFLDPQPVPSELPPGWPYTNLAPIDCSLEGSLRSTPGDATSIQFVNVTDAGAIVYRLDEVGNRFFIRQLQPFEGFIQPTETTHPFVVTSDTNECLGIFRGAATLGRAIAR